MKAETLSLLTAGRSLVSWKTDFYLPARQREIIDENGKAPRNCDWTVTLHVITNKYL